MWKYVTRRFRDTFERSANHFDKRPTTNACNSAGTVNEERRKRCPGADAPSSIQAWFCPRSCKKILSNSQNTNNKKWNFEQLNKSWIGAITWSSALALGWFTSQLIHLKLKQHCMPERKPCINVNNLLSSVRPFIKCINDRALFCNSSTNIEQIFAEFTPRVHLIANERSGVNTPPASTSRSATPDSTSENDLGNVLNSIENKLGLAAIESGQHQVGLNLLRSAANRHHAPAIFNLGLCYERGLGVITNEKAAMELYKAAAALQHPGALYNLGLYYGQGRGGLPHDLETATRLLRLAAVQGQQDAIAALKALDIEIEPPQVNIDPPQLQIDDTWLKNHNPLLHNNDHMVPAPTTLFVENTFFTQSHKPEATVF